MSNLEYHQIIEALKNLKHNKKTTIPHFFNISLPNNKSIIASLLTKKELTKYETIRYLSVWRSRANKWFPAQFPVTHKGTSTWAINQLLDMPDRVLFSLKKKDSNKPFGHIGLYRYDKNNASWELDNIIRGRKESYTKGAIGHSINELMNWAHTHFGVKQYRLRVFSDNDKALNLYKRLGFIQTESVPLRKKVKGKVISWIEDNAIKNPKRSFMTMELNYDRSKKTR